MTTLSRFVFYLFLMLRTANVRSETSKNENVNLSQSKSFHSNNGMMGVASVAEITLRNGRVSSTGGVKFFPADSKMNKDVNVNHPWTFTKIHDFPTANSKTNKDSRIDYTWTSSPDLNNHDGAKFNDPWAFTTNTVSGTNSKSNLIRNPWTFTKISGNGFAMGAVHAYPGSVAVSAVNIMDKPGTNLAATNSFMNWPHNDFQPRSSFHAHSNFNSMIPENVFKSFYPGRPDFGNMWFFPTYDPFLNVWQ